MKEQSAKSSVRLSARMLRMAQTLTTMRRLRLRISLVSWNSFRKVFGLGPLVFDLGSALIYTPLIFDDAAQRPKTKDQSPKTIHLMKRCPTCNQTFEEDWLSFCTSDGTSLVDFAPSPKEPPPTIRVNAPETKPLGKPTFDLPGSYTPPVQFEQPKTPAPLWQPSRPPPMA